MNVHSDGVVGKHRSPNAFWKLPVTVVEKEALSAEECLIFAFLRDRAAGKGWCVATRQHIAKVARCAVRSVSRHLRKLVEVGLIGVECRKPRASRFTIVQAMERPAAQDNAVPLTGQNEHVNVSRVARSIDTDFLEQTSCSSSAAAVASAETKQVIEEFVRMGIPHEQAEYRATGTPPLALAVATVCRKRFVDTRRPVDRFRFWLGAFLHPDRYGILPGPDELPRPPRDGPPATTPRDRAEDQRRELVEYARLKDAAMKSPPFKLADTLRNP